MRRLIGLLDWLRVHQPRAVTPLLVRFRATLTWSRPAERERARAAMRLLVPERSEAEVTALARRHVWFTCLRSETRYNPGGLVAQQVEGGHHLAAAEDRGRGVVLAFFHHGHYAGAFPSVAANGFELTVITALEPEGEPRPTWLRHLVLMMSADPGVSIVSSRIGFHGIAEVLGQGRTVVLSCDGPGRPRAIVPFLGREWHGLTTAAGLALATGAAVVPLTSWRRGRDGGAVRLGRALHPEDFTDAAALTRALHAALETPVRVWPEAYDVPLQLWVPAGSD